METVLQPAATQLEKENTPAQCFHCGTACSAKSWRKDDKSFCCNGCLTVFEILNENGLSDFYKLSEHAGVRVKASSGKEGFAFLDEPSVRERLVNFSDGKLTRVTLLIPANAAHGNGFPQN